MICQTMGWRNYKTILQHGDLGNVEVKMGQIIQGLSKERLGKVGAQKGY